MEIKYGVDAMNHCLIPLTNDTVYEAISDVINLKIAWNCRVQVTPNADFWIPFNLPLWGIVEPTHIHVDNHMNMIFHGFRGSLMGVAAYPRKL